MYFFLLFYFSISEIPSVGFAVSRTTHNIEDPKLYLRVQLDGKLVREFTVTMTLSNSTGHVIPDGELDKEEIREKGLEAGK